MGNKNLGLSIPPRLVDHMLLGPTDDQRQLQDSPILGDVWSAYAKAPAAAHDLLITPHMNATAGRVANAIAQGLKTVGRSPRRKGEAAQVAYLQGIVAAKLFFEEVLRILVPMTLWWDDKKMCEKLEGEYPLDPIRKYLEGMLDTFSRPSSETLRPPGYTDPIERYLALAGFILWAGQQKPSRTPSETASVLTAIRQDTDKIVAGLRTRLDEIRGDWKQGWATEFFPASDRTCRPPEVSGCTIIFSVSLNRRALPAVAKSVPAVKADAARTLFSVRCDKITWAVLDSGIDGAHPAFQSGGPSRVKKTFDFTRVRQIVSRDPLSKGSVQQIAADAGLEPAAARAYLRQLAEDAEEERPRKWDLIEKLVCLQQPVPPEDVHGTHVAGIIGAAAVQDSRYGVGMCPDIRLYDFRVLAKTMEDTEFAIIAALQYIRYVNELHNNITIHGANLSLSIPHDVRNYACGRTPICQECERLVESGVVVVAAAGNLGYQRFETRDGLYEGYAAFSITDPGNADGVITVGSTHRFWPHTYGVSFFSSRGPTGDGRLKPDLVAPGERIQAPMPHGQWGFESGTSMAAPHVSGAAAMLMARYPELVGQPRRIKDILCDTATDLGRERSFQGHGMLDVLRAFQSI